MYETSRMRDLLHIVLFITYNQLHVSALFIAHLICTSLSHARSRTYCIIYYIELTTCFDPFHCPSYLYEISHARSLTYCIIYYIESTTCFGPFHCSFYMYEISYILYYLLHRINYMFRPFSLPILFVRVLSHARSRTYFIIYYIESTTCFGPFHWPSSGS